MATLLTAYLCIHWRFDIGIFFALQHNKHTFPPAVFFRLNFITTFDTFFNQNDIMLTIERSNRILCMSVWCRNINTMNNEDTHAIRLRLDWMRVKRRPQRYMAQSFTYTLFFCSSLACIARMCVFPPPLRLFEYSSSCAIFIRCVHLFGYSSIMCDYHKHTHTRPTRPERTSTWWHRQ